MPSCLGWFAPFWNAVHISRLDLDGACSRPGALTQNVVIELCSSHLPWGETQPYLLPCVRLEPRNA